MPDRRQWLQWAAGCAATVSARWGVAQTPPSELSEVWRQSRGVLMLRHASTEPGVGDPPGFTLGQCSTQRNLSAQGRDQAQAMGRWMVQQWLRPDAVLSSQWCRCQDTARLAFGQVEAWPALNSTFAGQGEAAAQEEALRARLRQMPAMRMEVWVTHQVNMTALTGAYPDLGEAFVLDRQGRLLARGQMAA
ncbi:MAG: histidine phosphatase family protein [Limnohabitans sp.]